MSTRRLSNEFSICLVPETPVEHEVENLRSRMVASPYRDDPPHITLLRGINSPAPMSDEALLQDMERLQLSEGLPLECMVKEVTN